MGSISDARVYPQPSSLLRREINVRKERAKASQPSVFAFDVALVEKEMYKNNAYYHFFLNTTQELSDETGPER